MAWNETLIELISQMPQEMPAGLFSTFVFMAFIFVLILLLAILLFILWIWMIVDVAKRDKFRTGDRVVWILLIVLTGLIGMVLYFFLEMRHRKKRR